MTIKNHKDVMETNTGKNLIVDILKVLCKLLDINLEDNYLDAPICLRMIQDEILKLNGPELLSALMAHKNKDISSHA